MNTPLFSKYIKEKFIPRMEQETYFGTIYGVKLVRTSWRRRMMFHIRNYLSNLWLALKGHTFEGDLYDD